mmetsp:Transcript_5355/g.9132  ORF Transcript_5355/g.9132 Transcript_5355/m.9132 type:complete len:114 (-) Transcript_5355:439-780(-)
MNEGMNEEPELRAGVLQLLHDAVVSARLEEATQRAAWLRFGPSCHSYCKLGGGILAPFVFCASKLFCSAFTLFFNVMLLSFQCWSHKFSSYNLKIIVQAIAMEMRIFHQPSPI